MSSLPLNWIDIFQCSCIVGPNIWTPKLRLIPLVVEKVQMLLSLPLNWIDMFQCNCIVGPNMDTPSFIIPHLWQQMSPHQSPSSTLTSLKSLLRSSKLCWMLDTYTVALLLEPACWRREGGRDYSPIHKASSKGFTWQCTHMCRAPQP